MPIISDPSKCLDFELDVCLVLVVKASFEQTSDYPIHKYWGGFQYMQNSNQLA